MSRMRITTAGACVLTIRWQRAIYSPLTRCEQHEPSSDTYSLSLLWEALCPETLQQTSLGIVCDLLRCRHYTAFEQCAGPDRVGGTKYNVVSRLQIAEDLR